MKAVFKKSHLHKRTLHNLGKLLRPWSTAGGLRGRGHPHGWRFRQQRVASRIMNKK